MIRFNQEDHTYYVNDKRVDSVTQLLAKQGISPAYRGDEAETAANYGTLVHAEIVDLMKNKKDPFKTYTREALDIANDLGKNFSNPKFEQILYCDSLAGTADVIDEEKLTIVDFKITKEKHLESWKWQLSLYAYLAFKDRYNETKLFVYHHNGEKLEIINIDRVKLINIERLLFLHENKEKYSDVLTESIEKIARLKAEIEERERIIDNEKKDCLRLLKRLEITKASSDIGTVYIMPEGEVKSLDQKALREEIGDALNKFYKIRIRKESCYFKLKGGKNDDKE